MPQWTVEGANKTTGAETTLLIEAPTESAAREAAATQGLAVASVSPSEQHNTASSRALEYHRSAPPTLAGRFVSIPGAVRALAILALVFYATALLEIATTCFNIAATGSHSTLVQIGDFIAQTLFTALKTAILGATLQTVAALLPVLAERLAPPKR